MLRLLRILCTPLLRRSGYLVGNFREKIVRIARPLLLKFKSRWLPRSVVTFLSLDPPSWLLSRKAVHPPLALTWVDREVSVANPVGTLQTNHAECGPIEVYEFANCRVAGYFGAVVSPDNRALADLFFEWRDDPLKHEIFSKVRLPPPTHLSGLALLIATPFSEGYYHWLLEQMPKFQLPQAAGYSLEEFDHVLYISGPMAFVEQTMTYFPTLEKKMLRCDHHTHWICDRLVTCNSSVQHRKKTPWGVDCLPTASGVSFVRSTFLKGREKTGRTSRIYITRRGARGRRVDNEDQVLSVIKKHRFEPIQLESFTFDEQVELFSGAEAVLGPHGAGFTNIVFAPPGCIIVEFRSADFPPACYAITAQYLNHRYCHLLCEARDTDRTAEWRNLHVPVDLLDDLLNRVLPD